METSADPTTQLSMILEAERQDCPIRKSNIGVISKSYKTVIVRGEAPCSWGQGRDFARKDTGFVEAIVIVEAACPSKIGKAARAFKSLDHSPTVIHGTFRWKCNSRHALEAVDSKPRLPIRGRYDELAIFLA